MKYTHIFFRKLGKISQNLSSAAVAIGALRVNKGELVSYAWRFTAKLVFTFSRNWRYEQEIAGLLWKIAREDLKTSESNSGYDRRGSLGSRVGH